MELGDAINAAASRIFGNHELHSLYGTTRALVQDPALLSELDLPEGFTPLGSIVLGRTEERYAPREIRAGHHFAQNVVA